MEKYLEKLLLQIRCKKARPYIAEEIRGHIESQIEDNIADGMSYEEAEKNAVADMGDPVTVGISLDKIHKPQIAWKLLVIIDAMEGESRKTAYQRYNMISGILPFLSEENMRTEAIKRASERYGISKQTVRNYLCEYLATMDVRSLAPGYKKAEKKLSADEKNMRKSLNKWYYTTKKRTLKNCYTLMLQHFYCNADGSLKEQYPSYYQL